jgi:hypothetical protein
MWIVQNGQDVRATAAQLAITGSQLSIATTFTAYGAITGTASVGAYSYGTLSYSDTNIFASYNTSVNSYAQIILQNSNSGDTSSADLIVSNDTGTATNGYIDIGINSSSFSGAGFLNAANTSYVYSQGCDIVIGTNTSNTIYFTNNDASSGYATMSLVGGASRNNQVKINSPTATSSATLQLGGSISSPVYQLTGTAAYTIQNKDHYIIINNGFTTTLTFLSAASYTGMEIVITNIQAFAVYSATSNILPLNSATPGTAILPATAGGSATLVSNGAYWQIVR